jgi:nucleoid DNA-binding protein
MERLIHRLAEASNEAPEQVADQIDRLLTRMRRRLRAGRPVRLPGLGVLQPGHPQPEFRREKGDAANKPKAR